MNNTESLITGLASEIDASQYTHILGVSRGGLVPAVYLSHALSLPLIVTSYSSSKGNGDGGDNLFTFLDNKTHPVELHKSSVLVVDDIADTGNTLNEICNKCKTMFSKVDSAVLHYKQDVSCFVPTYYATRIASNDGWIVYPWEK